MGVGQTAKWRDVLHRLQQNYEYFSGYGKGYQLWHIKWIVGVGGGK
jgi:hypothetical protein